MGNIFSEDSLVKNCCNITDDKSYDDEEETYKIALKQDIGGKKRASLNRTQTPYAIKPLKEPELDSQSSFSFASAVDDE